MPRRSPRLLSPYFRHDTALVRGASVAKTDVKEEEDGEAKVKCEPKSFTCESCSSDQVINLTPDVSLRLQELYFHQECETLARNLLGKILVRRMESGSLVWGRIVETEAYLGGVDRASHSYNCRKTDRNMAMFMKPGTVYVYSIYGMYFCINISSLGEGAAVLIRAVEPMGGISDMKLRRGTPSKKTGLGRDLKMHQLCSGPSKLCIAFGINKSLDKSHLSETGSLWLQHGARGLDESVIVTSRIGMSDKAEEWKGAPLRFYLQGSQSVSVRDRQAECGHMKTERSVPGTSGNGCEIVNQVK